MKWILCVLFSLGVLAAEELSLESRSLHFGVEGAPPPPGAKVSLLLPAVVMIGQEIPAVLLVQNIGDKPFKISLGGDYRATGCPQRVKVRVRGAAMQLLQGLPQEAYGFGGGLGWTPEIQPGGSHRIEFPLACYVSFTKPGIYTVTAGHDLGWKVDAQHPHPLGKALLIVKEPTPEEATAHVDRVFDSQRLPAGWQESERLSLALDLERRLCVLRQPVYLPALRARAAAGSVAAVQGIGHVATPEATEALLALLENASPTVVEAALVQLFRRLPVWQDAAQQAPYAQGSSRYQIDPLLPASWQVRFEQPVLEAAVKLLSSPQAELVENAASLLRLRGGAEHAPALLAALQKAMDTPVPTHGGAAPNSLDFPRPQQALINALDALRLRGWRITGPGRTAPTVAWFRQLADQKIPRPVKPGWQSSMLTWVTNGPPLLKVCALEAIPQPLSDEAARAVADALEATDLRVLRTACTVAGKSGRPEFVRPLAQIVELSTDTFLQQAAHEAALACGARLELWEAWTAAITSTGRLSHAVRTLIEGTLEIPRTNGTGNSNFTRDQRFVLRDAWREFLQQHRQPLSQGRKVPPPGGELAARLTGASFDPASPVTAVDFTDGTRWPPRPPAK